MFRCTACGKTTTSGQKATKLILETRERAYLDEHGATVAYGTEIVREGKLGPCCAREAALKATLAHRATFGRER